MSQPSPERAIVHVSPRGGVTLPSEVRDALGIHGGDTLVLTVEDGRIVLRRAVVLPAESYDEARIGEFRDSAELTAEQVAEARLRWGV